MANRFVLLLSVFFFLGLSLAAGPLILAQAQSGGSRWIGAYALGDAVYLFRLEIPLSEEGTQFYQFGEPFPQAVRDLIVAGDTVQFSVRTPTGLARFSGFMEGERITGEVEIRGSLGNFVLLPAGVDLDPDPNVYIGDYRFISGSRNGEEILVSRGDQPDQFFYFHQGILTRIYATRSDQFLSARAEVVDFERNPSGAIRGLTIQDVFQLGQHGVEELVVTHPYRREEVSFKSGPVKLSGTLFLPNGEGPFPAVSLLHGAGAAERHFYRIYAAYFARSGIAALVYDKRGSGKSSYTGIEPSLEDLAGDATASLAYLASHPAIDPRAVGVWGLSQGGRIAPMAAANNLQVAFVLAVSPPGVSYQTLERLALADNYQQEGFSAALVATGLKFDCLRADIRKPLGEEDRADSQIDPSVYWERVTQPTLLIFGGQDEQIFPQVSTAAIEGALQRGGNYGVAIAWYPLADHNLMIDQTVGISILAQGFLDTMSEWINAWIYGGTSPDSPPATIGEAIALKASDLATVPTSLPACTSAGGLFFQLLWALLFGGIFLATIFQVRKLNTSNQIAQDDPARMLAVIFYGLSLLGLGAWLGWVVFIIAVFFPQGVSPSILYNAAYFSLSALAYLFCLGWLYALYLLIRLWWAGGLGVFSKRTYLGSCLAGLAFIAYLYYWGAYGFG